MPSPPSLPPPLPAAHGSDAFASLPDAGDLHFATDRLPWQRSLRWAEPPRDRRLWLAGMALAMLVTILELAGFAAGMRALRTRAPLPHTNEIVQVRLLNPDLPPPPPPPPEPEPPAFAKHPSRVAVTPPEVVNTPPPPHVVEPSSAMTGRLGSAGADVPAPKLFNPDGSIRLGSGEPTLPQAPRNAREAGKARWARIEKRGNPVDCQKTRFSAAYAPDMSAGDRIAGKYLKWVGLADPEVIKHRAQQRAESGGCEPAP